MGAQWSDIRDRCIRGRMQPSVLFYEREPDDVVLSLDDDYLAQSTAGYHPGRIEAQARLCHSRANGALTSRCW